MKRPIVTLFPGQGAQFPGMGRDFFDAFEVARHTFEEADDILKRPLSRLIFEGPADELTLTKNAQVALYVTSIAMWRASGIRPDICAGLSLGEYTAITAAGIASFADLLPLVQLRGDAMHAASERRPGTMAVVIGLSDFESLLPEGVSVANCNCPGQIVISGTAQGIEAAGPILKEAGAKRVLPLDVSGAFHSPLMQPAQEALSEAIAALPMREGSAELVMNVPGDFVTDLGDVRTSLLRQVTSPVYWERGIRAIAARGEALYIEIGPGKTLTGMNKKIDSALETLSIATVGDIDHAHR